jgi:hypothetical protein
MVFSMKVRESIRAKSLYHQSLVNMKYETTSSSHSILPQRALDACPTPPHKADE